MLSLAVLSLIVAMVAAIFGFGGIAVASFAIAKILFFVFLAVFVISLLLHLAGSIDRTTGV